MTPVLSLQESGPSSRRQRISPCHYNQLNPLLLVGLHGALSSPAILFCFGPEEVPRCDKHALAIHQTLMTRFSIHRDNIVSSRSNWTRHLSLSILTWPLSHIFGKTLILLALKVHDVHVHKPSLFPTLPETIWTSRRLRCWRWEQ